MYCADLLSLVSCTRVIENVQPASLPPTFGGLSQAAKGGVCIIYCNQMASQKQTSRGLPCRKLKSNQNHLFAVIASMIYVILSLHVCRSIHLRSLRNNDNNKQKHIPKIRSSFKKSHVQFYPMNLIPSLTSS